MAQGAWHRRHEYAENKIKHVKHDYIMAQFYFEWSWILGRIRSGSMFSILLLIFKSIIQSQ